MTYFQNSQIPEHDPTNNAALRNLIDNIISKNRDEPGATMVILNEVQSQIGYITVPMQEYIAAALNIPASYIHGVVTFYSLFSTMPRGKHTIKFCLGTACYVGGTPQLLEKAKQLFGIEAGQTSEDGEMTLEVCRCVGACSQAPVLLVDEQLEGQVTPMKMPKLLKKTIQQQGQ